MSQAIIVFFSLHIRIICLLLLVELKSNILNEKEGVIIFSMLFSKHMKHLTYQLEAFYAYAI